MTENLRKRFVKDTGLPIKIFVEPYFSHFMKLYDRQFQSLSKYAMFQELLSHFDNEQDYFEEYNRVKDAAITYLAENEAMQYFCKSEDMSKYKPAYLGYPSNSVFKETNVGKHFVSIDMIKGNFTALRHYNPDIVGGKETYEDFVGMFTEHEYIKKSKYIRQVIFGNQNPKRQTTYERYLMELVLSEIFAMTRIDGNKVAYLGTDEIVLDVSDYICDGKLDSRVEGMIEIVREKMCKAGINIRTEYFHLYRIRGTSGYMKNFEFATFAKDPDFKCVDAYEMPFVVRAYESEIDDTPNATEEMDMVFLHEGRLAKFLEPLNVEFTTEPKDGVAID